MTITTVMMKTSVISILSLVSLLHNFEKLKFLKILKYIFFKFNPINYFSPNYPFQTIKGFLSAVNFKNIKISTITVK